MENNDMSENQLAASIRSNKGKSANQKLRQSGNIPAVLYGPRGNILLEMEEESTRHLLEKMTGMHELVPIKVTDSASGDSWTAQVVLREVQKHPYKHSLKHLDFWELPAAKEQIVRIPIEVTGESPGVIGGGVLQMVVREIPVYCLPADIPACIELDSSKLELGDSIRILDIELPAKVSHSTEENYAVISIVGRAKEEEEVVVEEEISEGEEGAEETAADSAEEETANEE
ncbi:MAG: 50S ribosomal protein L25 [SAR324 cluster bacterium]|jgi:large subunit ribosomal protein L25|nr:50S ribosomal protein L25 [SAR324 cluster bacterium]MDP7614415.1 50S ribosomal protein L25 [SAR324 cluster bacterium]